MICNHQAVPKPFPPKPFPSRSQAVPEEMCGNSLEVSRRGTMSSSRSQAVPSQAVPPSRSRPPLKGAGRGNSFEIGNSSKRRNRS